MTRRASVLSALLVLDIMLLSWFTFRTSARAVPPAGMVRVAAGPLAAGVGRPLIYVGEFYIDEHEVTVREFGRFIKATRYSLADQRTTENLRAGGAEHPMVLVSIQEALAYARWRGARLPTEIEWEKAYYGVGKLAYPWGDDWVEGNAAIGSKGDAKVMTHPLDRSPCGAWDMAGNVFEWTLTPLPGEPDRIGVKGSAWLYKPSDDLGRRVQVVDGTRSHVVGIRCAWSAP